MTAITTPNLSAAAAPLANELAGSSTPPLTEMPEKIEVASYFNKTFQGAWKGRTRAMFGGIALGLVSGLAIGSVVFLPLIGIIGMEAAAIAIAFAGIAGLWQGQSAAADAGVTAGAVAAAFEEKEARDIAAKIAKGELPPEAAKVKRNSNGQVLPGSTSVAVSSPEEVNLHSKNFNELVNFKVMGSFVLAGAAIGLLIGSGGFIPAAFAPLINMVGAPAAGALLLGANGALFGFNYSVILNNITNFMGEWLSGKLFNGKTVQPSDSKMIANEKEKAVEVKPAQAVEKTAEISAPVERPLPETAEPGKFLQKELDKRAQMVMPGLSTLATVPR